MTKAMGKSWHRVNVYNQRMFKDLTSFTDGANHFVHIRNAVVAMSEVKASAAGTEDAASSARSSTRSKAASESKPTKPPACIPFLGASLLLYTALIALIHRPPLYRHLSLTAIPVQQAP